MSLPTKYYLLLKIFDIETKLVMVSKQLMMGTTNLK